MKKYTGARVHVGYSMSEMFVFKFKDTNKYRAVKTWDNIFWSTPAFPVCRLVTNHTLFQISRFKDSNVIVRTQK